MATWDPPSDAEIDVDKPIKAVDIRRIRDLSQAMAEGAAGAPIAGGIIPLATIDFAGEATGDFTAFDAAKYDSYVFKLANVIPATDGAELNLRTSTDGGSTYDAGASDYFWAGLQVFYTSGTVTGKNSGGGVAQIELAENVGSASGEDGVSGTVSVYGPHLTKQTFIAYEISFHDSGNRYTFRPGGGQRDSPADVDGVRFLFSAGNIESGTISMYGIIAP